MLTLEEARAFFQQDRFAMDLGIVIEAVDEHGAQCSVELNEGHLNARGVAQGGVVFTLADFTFAVAANYEAINTVTLDSNIHFLRAADCKTLTAKAVCEHRGQSVCVYRVNVTDEHDRAIAQLSATGFIMQKH